MTTRLEAIQERVRDDSHTPADVRWLVGTLVTREDQLAEIANQLHTARGFRTDMTPIELVGWIVHGWRGLLTEGGEIHDLLAEALGYQKAPSLEEDPNCPCPGDYVTGEHTAATLAMEAANRIHDLKQELADVWEGRAQITNEVIARIKERQDIITRLSMEHAQLKGELAALRGR